MVRPFPVVSKRGGPKRACTSTHSLFDPLPNSPSRPHHEMSHTLPPSPPPPPQHHAFRLQTLGNQRSRAILSQAAPPSLTPTSCAAMPIIISRHASSAFACSIRLDHSYAQDASQSSHASSHGRGWRLQGPHNDKNGRTKGREAPTWINIDLRYRGQRLYTWDIYVCNLILVATSQYHKSQPEKEHADIRGYGTTVPHTTSLPEYNPCLPETPPALPHRTLRLQQESTRTPKPQLL